MTEPVPSDYDRLVQDPRLDGLEELVHPYYQPPGDQEYSFPVVGQGVSSEMFQQISRAAGTGVFIQSNPDGAHPAYQLTNLGGGASATNANNQMLLRVAPGTGRGEAAIEGFFHTLLEDMVIDFPAVSTLTTYYLCLTYDPRREEEPAGPIRVEVHTNTLPTTHGRKHIVLYTVVRQPNQLLTDATVTQTGQWLGHVINVWSEDMLPEPTLTEYGTLAVVVNPQAAFGTDPELYTNRGIYGWQKVTNKQETSSSGQYLVNEWSNYGSGFGPFRITTSGSHVYLEGRISGGAWGTSATIIQLPAHMRPTAAKLLPANGPDGRLVQLIVNTSGAVRPSSTGSGRPAWISFDSTFYTTH